MSDVLTTLVAQMFMIKLEGESDIGLTVREVDTDKKRAKDPKKYYYVASVAPGSPAESAGIPVGKCLHAHGRILYIRLISILEQTLVFEDTTSTKSMLVNPNSGPAKLSPHSIDLKLKSRSLSS
jgi:hypothetical protein